MNKTYYEQAELVIKHTFLEFRCLDEDASPKLRRHKSDPLFACAELVLSDVTTCKLEVEAPTPTTCASSVNGDDDDESFASSPGDGSNGNKFCFSSSVIGELLDFPQVPSQDATRGFQAPMPYWPQSCSTPTVLSTCPVTHHASNVVSNTSCPSAQASNTGQTGSSAACSGGCFDLTPQADDTQDDRTTLMVRNLPAELSQPALVQKFIEAGYGGLFDFVYMPMNFRANGNFGYAFVNFTSHAVAAQVVAQMQPLETEDTSASGRWTSAWSTCQGLSANVERYRNSPLMHDTVPWEYKPSVYDCFGNRVQFPKPTKNISKPRIHWPGAKDARIQ